MPVAPSFDDMLGQFEAEALAQRSTLKFREGDIVTAQEHGAGAMGDAAIRYGAQALKETFLDGAEADKLTALVDDHINMQRNPATAASVDVTFTRTSGGAGGTTAVGFTVASTFDAAGNSVLFTTNTPITWGAGDNGPHIVTCAASVLGAAGNASAGTVTRLVSTPFDPTVACTNAADAAGGNEEESDPELRDRARNFWITLRRGTLASLEQGALDGVASVRVASASEDPTTGAVTLVVGDSNGNSTAQMVSDTETVTEQWRAGGSLVTIVGATQLAVAITGVMIFRKNSGADPLVYAPLVVAAITARMAKFKQGETMYLDAIKAAGIAVAPNVLEAIQLSTPLIDTVPTTSQTIRAGVITITG